MKPQNTQTHCRISTRRMCISCGYTMKISSSFHRLLIFYVKTTKIVSCYVTCTAWSLHITATDRKINFINFHLMIIKGTYTIYFSSSFYFINQKPMMPTTSSLYIIMDCTFFWVKFGNAFAYFVVPCLLSRWCYYSI